MPLAFEPSQRFHKLIRLPKQHYIGRRAYFLTLCTRDRTPYFRSPRIARWLLENLLQIAAQQSFSLRAYCLMPDHLPYIAAGRFPIFGPPELCQYVQTQNHVLIPRQNRKHTLANFFL